MPYEIVGLVEGNVLHRRAQERDAPHVLWTADAGYAGAVVVETARPMNDMESIARRTLMEINPNLAMQKFETFNAQIAGRFTHEQVLSA
jgi:hypothetical protein